VEPDFSVWHILAHNQQSHHCAFWTVRGVVSNQPHNLSPQSYGTRAIAGWAKNDNSSAYVDLKRLQEVTKLRFTTLLIDCEGCIDSLFWEDNIRGRDLQLQRLQNALESVRTVILEADMGKDAPDCYSHCVDYDLWDQRFRSLGFTKVHQERDPRFRFIFHYVYQRQ
jgi:hypothetical protein